MAIIRELKGVTPFIGDNCFLAETSVLIGDVVLGNDCSVWYNAVLRGDVSSIRIGNRVNIQDCSVLHARRNISNVEIHDDVTIGHNVCIHGARIESKCLIGIGSIILDNSIIHSNSIIAAGSLVTEGTEVESYSIWAGVPARKVKVLDKNDEMTLRAASNYLLYMSWYR